MVHCVPVPTVSVLEGEGHRDEYSVRKVGPWKSVAMEGRGSFGTSWPCPATAALPRHT